uniref:Sodium/solute symporter n=1 Tax=Timema cristinae TaxID=61476 RepID=A0A7R9CYI7_TIMCR|nr:unnamed protein product [Timema cristinae]
MHCPERRFGVPLVKHVDVNIRTTMSSGDCGGSSVANGVYISKDVVMLCSQGGLKAVIWTDVIQSGFIFGSVLLVIIKGTLDVGGPSVVWERNYNSGRLEAPVWDVDPTVRHTVWSLVFGGSCMWLVTNAVDQGMTQRYMALGTAKQASMALWISTIGVIVLILTSCYSGMVIFATYHDCDPLTSKLVQAKDQLLPLLVMNTLGKMPGIPGMFLAGIFSAALSQAWVDSRAASRSKATLSLLCRALESGGQSTCACVGVHQGGLSTKNKPPWRPPPIEPYQPSVRLLLAKTVSASAESGVMWSAQRILLPTLSTGLNSMAGVILEDFCKPHRKKPLTERQMSIIMKTVVVVAGLMCIALVFVVEKLGTVLQGVFIGGLSGLGFVAWLSLGAQAAIASNRLTFPTKPVSVEGCTYSFVSHNSTTTVPLDTEVFGAYRLSYMWYYMVGCVVTILVSVVVSLLTQSKDVSPVDPKLLSPLIRRFMPTKKKDKLGADIVLIGQGHERCGHTGPRGLGDEGGLRLLR